MEERNLELDDGKIKLKKNRENFLSDETAEGDDIVIEVPDFEAFRGEDGRVGLSDEELAAKAKEREERAEERRGRAERLLEEADGLFASGDLDGAGEKYLDSAAEYAADWRPWFGVVRVQTKDLTDFKDIYDCQKAYDRAFRRMSGEDRAALAEKYVPSMESLLTEKEAEAAELAAQDTAEREAARGGLREECRASSLRLGVLAGLFVLFAAAGGILSAFISTVRGMQILIPAVICGAAAVVFLFAAAWALRRFVSAKRAYKANLRAGTTECGRKAQELTEYAELVRSVIGDLQGRSE